MEPNNVSQAGSAHSRRFLGRLAAPGDLLGRPDGLARRDFGAVLWDLRSIRNPLNGVGEGGLEPPRPLGH
jgi:hypothetical protein